MIKIISRPTRRVPHSLQGKKLILIGNNEKLHENYFAIPILLSAVLLILIGCKKSGDGDQPVPTLATVSLVAANTITQTTAQTGGNISSDGGATISARGVCWNTTNNPTISDSKTTDGTGAGSFTSTITGLTANTKYYIRAYATNSAGTAYSNEESFTTQQTATTATLTTTAASIITQTTALSGGNITSDGGAPITARGICWSATTGPTVADFKTIAGTGIGNFTSYLTGMSANTVYYVRAYATNSAGTAYGNEVTFTTQPISANTVTDIDGNVYNTVTIGTQVWMLENLKTTHYRNGDAIPTDLSDAAWGATTAGAYAIYGDNPANNTVYGKLYNWFAVVDSRSIAPEGWHVPTAAEITTLTSFLGGSTIAGIALKESGLTHWNSPNAGATNSSGFTGLPGGSRNTTPAYNYMGDAGYWWSTTEDGTDAQALGLFTNSDEANIVTGSKIFGTSIRCIKDWAISFKPG